MSNAYKGANPVNNNGTIHVWIHAHTHDDPGWLVTADQYYIKVYYFIFHIMISKFVIFLILLLVL